MATRFYYWTQSLFWVNPRPSNFWNITGDYDVKGMGQKVNTPIVSKIYNNYFISGHTSTALNRIYISLRLTGEHIFSGQVSGQLLGWQSCGGQMSPMVRVMLVNSSGEIKSHLATHLGGSGDLYFNSNPAYGQNRFFPPVKNLSYASGSKDDCITVEIGGKLTQGPNCTGLHYFGDNTSLLPIDNTFISTSGAGWIEFSNDIPVKAEKV